MYNADAAVETGSPYAEEWPRLPPPPPLSLSLSFSLDTHGNGFVFSQASRHPSEHPGEHRLVRVTQTILIMGGEIRTGRMEGRFELTSQPLHVEIHRSKVNMVLYGSSSGNCRSALSPIHRRCSPAHSQSIGCNRGDTYRPDALAQSGTPATFGEPSRKPDSPKQLIWRWNFFERVSLFFV